MNLFPTVILFLHFFPAPTLQQEVGPCTVQTGDSHLILSIVESLDDETSQETTPAHLPISGLPGTDMELEIHYADDEPDSRRLFVLDSEKRLRLIRPLDRDEQDMSSIMFQVCNNYYTFISLD